MAKNEKPSIQQSGRNNGTFLDYENNRHYAWGDPRRFYRANFGLRVFCRNSDNLYFFLIVLAIQLYVNKYVAVYFWLVIIATTTLGTEISDFMDRSLGLGYMYGSLVLVIGLIAILSLWYVKFKNLEVFPIVKRNKELFFWTAVLFSNSLGTAFGDYLSDKIGLNYLTGALVTGTIIMLVMSLHYFTKINHILLFWIAFVFTRPFGATFGDFLTKPTNKGGLDLSTLLASVVSLVIIAILVYISTKQHQKKMVKDEL